MGTKSPLEEKTIKEESICNADGISNEVQQPTDQVPIHLRLDPYSEIKTLLTQAWSADYKEAQAWNELIAKSFIRRIRQ